MNAETNKNKTDSLSNAMLTRDSHASEGTESSLLRGYTYSLAKNLFFQTIIFSYTTNLGTEETFLVKRSSGDNYKREVYSKANAKNTNR